MNYVWPLFFKRFPLGQIWLVKLSNDWWNIVWSGEKHLAKHYGCNIETMSSPQDASGVITENFPLAVLDMLAYGIYPLVLCDYIHTSSDLVFIYIPDRGFKYSQMTEKRTIYQEILWRFHHIFDDQWTFDGTRGPKSQASEIFINPIKQLDYFEWFLGIVNNRMNDIAEISNLLYREKLGMTINRAICDAVLSVSSELPYMSKVFFFPAWTSWRTSTYYLEIAMMILKHGSI